VTSSSRASSDAVSPIDVAALSETELVSVPTRGVIGADGGESHQASTMLLSRGQSRSLSAVLRHEQGGIVTATDYM
jgi:hypothetical protein